MDIIKDIARISNEVGDLVTAVNELKFSIIDRYEKRGEDTILASNIEGKNIEIKVEKLPYITTFINNTIEKACLHIINKNETDEEIIKRLKENRKDLMKAISLLVDVRYRIDNEIS